MNYAVGIILIVEDCDEDFETVLEAARRLRLSNPIHRTRTGQGTLSLLREWDRLGEKTALVLMDLNIAEVDGLEALRQIKQDENLRNAPVVIVSTSSNPRDLADCYGAGANAYHIKPVEYPLHLKTLQLIFDYWLAAVRLPVPFPSCQKRLGIS